MIVQAATFLTHHPAKDFAPVWSPDGTEIAFVSDRDGQIELYKMNIDGSHVTQLTDLLQGTPDPLDPGYVANAEWSPDGKKIAFDLVVKRGSHGETFPDMLIVNSTGGTPILLAESVGVPEWSPDGRKILFAYDQDYTAQSGRFGVMNADGSHT